MALLCTLHADGPKTLRLLREAGCTTIDKLGQLRPEKVGKLLGLPPAAARRLTKEALRLLDRLEPDLEQEEVTYPPAARPPAVKPPPKSFRLEEAPVESGGEGLRSRGDLDLRDRALLDRVVERWRSEDAAAALDQDDELLRQIEIREGSVRAVEEPQPAPQEAPAVSRGVRVRMRPGDLPGMDPEACAALERGGIHSLEDLATCPIDELVTRTGLAFTRSRTLQFLAGRELAQHPSVEPDEGTEEPPERLSPRESPTFLEPARGLIGQLPDDGGAAGPFA